MSDIDPSLVSSELTTIETFKDTTEKRGSKLTLNELNYISDKQLHQKTDGGGSEDSPVKLANIVFHTPSEEAPIGAFVDFVGPAVAVYTPAQEGAPALVLALSDDALNVSAEIWNSQNLSIIVPTAFLLTDGGRDLFDLEITGDAEIIPKENSNALYITGDCTITVSVQDEINE